MPRRYERKTDRDTAPKPQQALRALQKAWDLHAKPNGWPKGFPVPIMRPDAAFCEALTRLFLWLKRLSNNPVAYAALLQIWLDDQMNLEWPKGVFKDDVTAKRPGRPNKSELGRKATRMYKPGTFGFAKVAKDLLSDAYKKNPATAIKAVRDAMATYRDRAATKYDFIDDARDLVDQMLGIDRTSEEKPPQWDEEESN